MIFAVLLLRVENAAKLEEVGRSWKKLGRRVGTWGVTKSSRCFGKSCIWKSFIDIVGMIVSGGSYV